MLYFFSQFITRAQSIQL